MSDDVKLPDAGEEDVLERLFGWCPDASRLRAFNSPRSFGFVIEFSEKGFGFGQITFSVNKETGAVHVDDECMHAEDCVRFIKRLAGTIVELSEHWVDTVRTDEDDDTDEPQSATEPLPPEQE